VSVTASPAHYKSPIAVLVEAHQIYEESKDQIQAFEQIE
jgi:hypothetical protein